MSDSLIHPTAIIESGAEIGEGTSVGPYSIIRSNVRIGARCKIGPHVVIEGYTTLGDDNEISQFASVGSKPQDLKYQGEPSRLVIGDRNIIREFTTLQPGTKGGGMITKIGSQNLFMANSHIGHDALVGDKNIFANSCALAGHVTIGNGVILGGLSAVHQFVHIGDLCMMAGGALIVQDAPPFCLAHGNRAEIYGLNEIGLKRAGVSSEEIMSLRKVFRGFFYASGNVKEKLKAIESIASTIETGRQFCAFIQKSERGVMPSHRRRASKLEKTDE